MTRSSETHDGVSKFCCFYMVILSPEVCDVGLYPWFCWQEYVKNLSSSGMQAKHGLDGQFNACWTHQIAPHELDRVRSAGIGVAVIHGR